jgi:hypothetical protein
VLDSIDVTVEEVRAQVARIVGQGDEVTTGQIPFTPRAKKVLELSLREALWLGHNYVGTEHILLGLVRENEGVAARILLDFDADAEKVRNATIRLLPGHYPEGFPHEPLAEPSKRVVVPSRRRSPSRLPLHTATYAPAPPHREDMSLLIMGASIATAGLGIGLALGWLIWG